LRVQFSVRRFIFTVCAFCNQSPRTLSPDYRLQASVSAITQKTFFAMRQTWNLPVWIADYAAEMYSYLAVAAMAFRASLG